MYDAVFSIAMVVAGVGLTLAGLFVYRKGMLLFGALAGVGLAGLGTTALGVSGLPQVAAALGVGLFGAVTARLLSVVLVPALGAATGFGAGLALTGTTLTPVSNALDPVVVGGAVVGAALSVVLRQVVVALVSAAWGATLVWVGLETQAIVDALVGLRLPAPPAWVLGLALVGALAQVAVWAYLNDYDERVRDLLADLREDGSAAGPTPATAAEAGDAATDTWEDGREETASTEETDAWGEDPDV